MQERKSFGGRREVRGGSLHLTHCLIDDRRFLLLATPSFTIFLPLPSSLFCNSGHKSVCRKDLFALCLENLRDVGMALAYCVHFQHSFSSHICRRGRVPPGPDLAPDRPRRRPRRRPPRAGADRRPLLALGGQEHPAGRRLHGGMRIRAEERAGHHVPGGPAEGRRALRAARGKGAAHGGHQGVRVLEQGVHLPVPGDGGAH